VGGGEGGGAGGGFFVLEKKITKKCSVLHGNRTHAFLEKKGFSRRSPLRESNPRHPLRHRSTNELRYVTLVTTQLALRLRLVRTSRRNFFSPGKRHISASSEGRIGPNSRVGAPPNSSRLRGPPRNRKSSGDIFLRCCYTIPKQASKLLPNPPPPPPPPPFFFHLLFKKI